MNIKTATYTYNMERKLFLSPLKLLQWITIIIQSFTIKLK